MGIILLQHIISEKNVKTIIHTILVCYPSSCYGLIEKFISASTFQLVKVTKVSIKKGIPYQVESGLITEESSLLLFEDYITFTKDTQIYVFAHHIIEKCINLTVGTSQLRTNSTCEQYRNRMTKVVYSVL